MKLVDQAPIKPGTKVFVSLDIDVPIIDKTIKNTFRLDHGLKTLHYIINKGGFPIIGGHIKQPHGNYDPALSIKNLIPYYDKNLGKGKYELLENLRFDIREEQNDTEYAQMLAEKADIFVNEIFSTSHRQHASIVGIPKYLPGYAGFQLYNEVSTLSNVLTNPKKPLVAIVGGIKIESKQPAIIKFLEIADAVLVGGTLGLQWKKEKPNNLFLPTDYAYKNKDIGKRTIATYVDILKDAQTIVWAGPVGLYQEKKFSTGTKTLAHTISERTHQGAHSIAGGGNTIEALKNFGYLDDFSFVSTGGGAMLNLLIHGTLPGIEALNQHV